MPDQPFDQKNLTLQRSNHEETPQTKCPGTPGDIVDIKVGDGGGHDLSSLVIDWMVD
jgi:hypothetical protein